MAFWVYILRCTDTSYYTGHTDNLEKRIGEHMAGAIVGCYTFDRRPVELVYSQEFPTRAEALASEQQIKGWSRKKKEAMMRGDWGEVSRLAKPLRPAPPTPVRPVSSISVRPELVEGPMVSVPASTSSARTEQFIESPLPSTPVRPEPVEGPVVPVPASTNSARTGNFNGLPLPSTPVRPELVEGPVVPVPASTGSARTEQFNESPRTDGKAPL